MAVGYTYSKCTAHSHSTFGTMLNQRRWLTKVAICPPGSDNERLSWTLDFFLLFNNEWVVHKILLCISCVMKNFVYNLASGSHINRIFYATREWNYLSGPCSLFQKLSLIKKLQSRNTSSIGKICIACDEYKMKFSCTVPAVTCSMSWPLQHEQGKKNYSTYSWEAISYPLRKSTIKIFPINDVFFDCSSKVNGRFYCFPYNPWIKCYRIPARKKINDIVSKGSAW